MGGGEPDLVTLVKQGDLDAFETLYQSHRTAVYRTAYAILRDEGVAEEILQDTFLRAYRSIQTLEEHACIGAWLHRIAVNLSYNWLKKKRLSIEPLADWAERVFPDKHDSPERTVEIGELRDQVHEAINSLDFKHRAVVVLFYLQDFSLAQIAYILECPVGTVKSRLHYACKVLRKKLAASEVYVPRGTALEPA